MTEAGPSGIEGGPSGPGSSAADSFMGRAAEVLARVRATQTEAIRRAGGEVARATLEGHRVWAFGTGHSHMIAEELYGRAGGWATLEGIFEPSLMLHEGLAKSTALERLPGLAAALLVAHPVGSGDVLIVASNSGRNAVPVELATAARAAGAVVVAITSLTHSRAVASRAPSRKRLFEVADIVIDNCGEVGDALLDVPGAPARVGATSTVAGALIAQAIVCEAARAFAISGGTPPVLVSNNVDPPAPGEATPGGRDGN